MSHFGLESLYYCVNVLSYHIMFHYFVDNQKKAMSNALSVCTGQAGPMDAPVNAVSGL